MDIKCKDVGLSINGNILDGISLCIAEDVDNGLVGGGSLCDGLWGTVIDDILSQLFGYRDTVDKGDSIAEYIRNSNYGLS